MAATILLINKEKSKVREKQYLVEDTVQSKRLKYMKINNATNSETNQSKKYMYYET